MTVEELTARMIKTPIRFDPGVVVNAKLYFLLNLLTGQEFTDEQLRNACDALTFDKPRAIIRELVGLKEPDLSRPVLAGPDRSTIMPISLMADQRGDIKRRILAFLRPDPKMMIEVEKIEVDTEPNVTVFQVTIEDGRGGSWCETFTTEDRLKAFLRGVRVTFAMSDLQLLLPDFGDNRPLAFTEMSAVQNLP